MFSRDPKGSAFQRTGDMVMPTCPHSRIPTERSRWACVAILAAVVCAASDLDEFKVKRQGPFEFARRPTVTRAGDRVTIQFETKAFCDVTVAIEESSAKVPGTRGGFQEPLGRIVRHLASGVLGPNAPKPFQKNSKKQTIVWDGKDDQGVYVDDKDAVAVRVSLGLKPRFERSLLWSPHRRISSIAPLICPTPEGVYVFQGRGVDDLKLFDHDAKYVRTVYPFPANKIDDVKGLQRHTFPQDGQALPLKLGFNQATLLSSGSSASPADIGHHYGGYAATAMDVWKDRIALVSYYLNRVATDGSSGGLPIKGPKTALERKLRRGRTAMVSPTSVAFSPDGQWLYMTGYVWKYHFFIHSSDSFHVVMRCRYDSQDTPTVFVGETGKRGTDDAHFCVPTSVDCDAKGRVYVSDYMNDRIQVFSPDAKHLKTIKTVKPARVLIDPKTQEIWSFSWPAIGASREVMRNKHFSWRELKPTATRLGTFEQSTADKPILLPISHGDAGGWSDTAGQTWQVALDPWADGTPLWIVGRSALHEAGELHWSGGAGRVMQGMANDAWAGRGIRVIRHVDGQWKTVHDFGKLTVRRVKRAAPPDFARQRLYVNPKTGNLWVGEDMGFCKSFDNVPIIDPDTGRVRLQDIPFDAEDICFDRDGLIYMRTDTVVMRFDPTNWREVPWDYGEVREKVYFQGFHAPRLSTPAIAALRIPGRRPTPWHMAGMAINVKGNLAVTCSVRKKKEERTSKDRNPFAGAAFGEAYTPQMYPGRAGAWVVNVYDPRGKIAHEDAVPGLPGGDGIGIDKDDNLYILVSAPRVIDGKRYFNGFSETLMKFKPGKAKFLSSSRARVPLPPENRPKRDPDITRYGIGATWAEEAEWTYGGVGYGGQGGSCVCWHARFVLDDLARSFVPEVRRFTVAVLDTNGNLITRIGRYGNVDDGVPLMGFRGQDTGLRDHEAPPQAVGLSRPAGSGDTPYPVPGRPRSIGGDEVAIAHCAYVGVQTDRRLYLSDTGNQRILSVRLDYHATERVALRDVKDRS